MKALKQESRIRNERVIEIASSNRTAVSQIRACVLSNADLQSQEHSKFLKVFYENVRMVCRCFPA